MIVDDAGARAWLRSLPECDEAAWSRLEQFELLLREESARQNLVSKDTLRSVWQRHIADSAQLLIDVPRGTIDWLDIGSGAGLPGVVVACLRPETNVVLFEPRTRRAEWLLRAASDLRLGNVSVFRARIERAEQHCYEVISARAVAELGTLLDMSARFSTARTIWRLPKGQSAAQELDSLRGWDHTFHVEQSLTDPNSGIIVGTLHGKKGGVR